MITRFFALIPLASFLAWRNFLAPSCHFRACFKARSIGHATARRSSRCSSHGYKSTTSLLYVKLGSLLVSHCCASGRTSFVFLLCCESLALALGVIGRNARSECGGPKTGSKTPCYMAVNSEQSTGVHRRTQWTTNNRITMHSHGDRPKCRSRSYHHTGHINNV